ncbi:DNA polymerase ligase N-terminal domain-containing protein [Candidatus Dependentiae bacterium]
MDKKIIFLILCSFLIIGYIAVLKKDQLETYKKRRNFTKSPEPSGKKEKTKGKNIFVIQKHAATRLHYDFRLEIDGVLASWAIPKGPSLDPKEKRLAIRTDDHPLDYAKFEGVIPEGNYGAGTVMVWDIGTYRNIKEKDGKSIPLEKCLKNGQIEVWLEGKKLKGGYALIKMKREGQWLLIKMKDDFADARRNPVNTQTESALTGKTMNQIAKDE